MPAISSMAGMAMPLLAVCLSLPAHAADVEAIAEALTGEWTCAGSNPDVSFTSSWSLGAAGSYVDVATVTSRQLFPGEDEPSDLVVTTEENGNWSIREDGNLRAHIDTVTVQALSKDGVSLTVEEAREALSDMTQQSAGRVVTVDIVSIDDNSFVARVSGLLTQCER